MDDSRDAHLVVCGLDSVKNMSSIFTNSEILILTRASRNFQEFFDRFSEERSLHVIAESKTKQKTSPLVAITKVLPPLDPRDVKIVKVTALVVERLNLKFASCHRDIF